MANNDDLLRQTAALVKKEEIHKITTKYMQRQRNQNTKKIKTLVKTTAIPEVEQHDSVHLSSVYTDYRFFSFALFSNNLCIIIACALFL